MNTVIRTGNSGTITETTNQPAWADLNEPSALDVFKICAPQLKGLDIPRFIDSCVVNRGDFIVTLGKEGAPNFIGRDLNLNGDNTGETVNVVYLSEGERVASSEHGQGQDLMQFGQACQYLSANGYTSSDLYRMLNGHEPGEPGELVEPVGA
jgi:hypothetical protein